MINKNPKTMSIRTHKGLNVVISPVVSGNRLYRPIARFTVLAIARGVSGVVNCLWKDGG